MKEVVKHITDKFDVIEMFKFVEEDGNSMIAKGIEDFDEKRQMRISQDESIDEVDLIRNFLKEVFEDDAFESVEGETLEVSLCSCLIAYPGLLEQVPHTDFSDWPDHPPSSNFIVFVSMMPNTKIVVFDNTNKRSVVMLNAGDVFVGRGDIVHAGAAYDKHNVRLHFYVKRESCPLPNNETYLIV